MFQDNHGKSQLELLSRGQDVGVLELVTLIPLEGISSVQDLQLGPDGTEESVQLCNVQPRVDTLIKEIPINWGQLGSSDGAELQLLIEEHADVFALDSSEVGRTEVVEHSIDTLSQNQMAVPSFVWTTGN